MARNLSPDETALWARVMESVRPLRAALVPAQKPAPVPVPVPSEIVQAPAPPKFAGKSKLAISKIPARLNAPVRPAAAAPRPAANTLDGGWDRRLTRGVVAPDTTVDLHGHSLHSAHDLLDAALAGAIARGDRVVLLVTGRPPRAESERPHARGAIRAAVGDWLAASRHDRHIAAVRGAHPRHGGAGALYLILKRPRGAMP